MQKLNLRELKGAPLSIILAIVMAGNRNVSVSYLVTKTGWSEKTIKKGLNLLMDSQIVTLTRYNRYQLTGENLQLPLYWNEQTVPADPTPASDQLSFFDAEDDPEKFLWKNSGSALPGKSPESGEIPEMKRKIIALEARVTALEAEKNPRTGKIPAETGEFSNDDIKSSSIITSIIDIVSDDEAEKIPESGEIPDDYRNQFLEIYEYYKNANGTAQNPYAKIHGMIDYSEDELNQLIRLHADTELVDFVLPAAGSYETAKTWLSLDIKTAKIKLCEKFGIYRAKAEKMAERKDISLSAIQYHYWNWRLFESNNGKITLGTVIFRIENHFDQGRINSEWPLICGYLD